MAVCSHHMRHVFQASFSSLLCRLELRGCNIRKCSSACGDLDLGPRAPQRPLHQQSVVETFLRRWRRIANPHHLSSFFLRGFAAAALLVGRGPWFARSGTIMHDLGSQRAHMRVFRRRSMLLARIHVAAWFVMLKKRNF